MGFSLTNQLTNIPEQVQASSPATGRKVKSMSTPGGIKFDPDYSLFSKHTKIWVQAGCECCIRPVPGLFTQGNSHTWQNVCSWSSITLNFMDQKIRCHFWHEDSWRWKDCVGKELFSDGSKCNLKLWVVYIFWGLVPFAFPPFFSRKFQRLPIFQPTEKLEDAQSAAWLPGPPPCLCPAVRGCVLLWLLSGGRFVSGAELWAPHPSASSASRALPIVTQNNIAQGTSYSQVSENVAIKRPETSWHKLTHVSGSALLAAEKLFWVIGLS